MKKKIEKLPNCPDCGSKNVASCKGGTCKIPDYSINWICEECLNEW